MLNVRVCSYTELQMLKPVKSYNSVLDTCTSTLWFNVVLLNGKNLFRNFAGTKAQISSGIRYKRHKYITKTCPCNKQRFFEL